MQDLSTGKLTPIHREILEGIPVLQMQDAIAKIQAAKDSVQPNRSLQGPLYFVGQELEILGGRFRVVYIKPNRMALEPVKA